MTYPLHRFIADQIRPHLPGPDAGYRAALIGRAVQHEVVRRLTLGNATDDEPTGVEE